MPRRTRLDAEELCRLLPGWNVTVVDETGSTNVDLRAAAPRLPEWSALVTEYQNAGHGRFERAWIAPPGAALATSVLVRPTVPVEGWGWLSLLVGCAVADAITHVGGAKRAQLKWPNDVMLDGKKTCGILCEAVSTPNGMAAICGWGVNTWMNVDELPVPTATSLAIEGIEFDTTQLETSMLSTLRALIERWEAGERIHELYAGRCSTIGRHVRVMFDEERGEGPGVSGRAVGVDPSGALLVEVDGTVRSFTAGDVVHVR